MISRRLGVTCLAIVLAAAACSDDGDDGGAVSSVIAGDAAPSPSVTTTAGTPATTDAGEAPGTDAGLAEIEDGLLLRRETVTDPQIFDIAAFSLLVPESWEFSGAVEWRHDISTLASGIVTARDPVNRWALETFWLVPHVWTQDSLIPVGGNWAGAIVQPPRSATDLLLDLVIPEIRPGATVVDAAQLPDVAAALDAETEPVPGTVGWTDAARVRVGYDTAEGPVEEDFYVHVSYLEGAGITQWVPLQLYSFTAPEGELGAATPFLQTVIGSTEVTPLWTANYQVVFNMFLNRQYGAIEQAGQLSQYLTQNAEEISAIQMEAWENQQAAYDRVFDSYSEYVKGVYRQELPNGDKVLMPNSVLPCMIIGSDPPAFILMPLIKVCPRKTTLLP